MKRVVNLPAVMDIITELVGSVHHGTITLIVQDGCLVQIERNDKIRIDVIGRTSGSILSDTQAERLQNRLQTELDRLQFGQVVLTIKNGVIVQIERTEKQRFGLEGIYGDGI